MNDLEKELNQLGDLFYELKGYIKKLNDIKAGKYDYILNCDIDAIRKQIESGKVFSNDSVVLKLSINDIGNDTVFLVKAIKIIRQILVKKDALYKKINEQKKIFKYNPEEEAEDIKTVYDKHEKYTYKQAIEIIENVEKICMDGRIFQLLDFYRKNSNLIKELWDREKKILASKDHEAAHDVIKSEDDEVGIIVINDSQKGVRVVAGTRKEMELSNILDVPYPKDIDKPEFDNTYFHSDAHKIEKRFIPANSPELTPEHIQMIKAEIERKKKLKHIRMKDELGYINGLVVSRNELLDNGLDPKKLGWKSLRVKRKKENMFKIYKEANVFGYPVSAMLQDYIADIKDISGSRRK